MAPEPTSPDQEAPASAHISPRSLLAPTIEAWRYYLEDQQVSRHTIKAFASDLQLLASYLPPDRSIGAIAAVDLTNFLDWLQNGRGVACSPKSLARRITSLKAFFRWLSRAGVLLIDPSEKIPQRSVISPLPVVLTPDETEYVLNTAQAYRQNTRPDTRFYALVALLLQTGIKKGECLAIHLNHIEPETPDGPVLFVRYANPQNRYKERKIALTEEWLDAYQEYRLQYQLTDQLFPWSQRRLEYLLEDLGLAAGLDKHLSFDMCRWTCALADWRSDIDRNAIRQKLGISKIQWREIGMKLEQLAQT
jgi:site-specific recombinase XerD